jgi:hypothetical protein
MLTLQSADAFWGLETAEALNSAQIGQPAQTFRVKLTLDEKIGLMH